MKTIDLCEDPDFYIQISNTLYAASSTVLKAKSTYFEEVFKETGFYGKKLEIQSPFSNEAVMLLEWLHTSDTKELIKKINSISEVIQIHIISKVLKVKKFTNLRNILLSFHFCPDFFDPQISISSGLCKELVDLRFLLECLRNFNFHWSHKTIKICILLDWLGEKNCYTEEEILELISSKEFRDMKKIVTRENLIPDQWTLNEIQKIYPIGIKSIL
jgi:BTB/POZ domain